MYDRFAHVPVCTVQIKAAMVLVLTAMSSVDAAKHVSLSERSTVPPMTKKSVERVEEHGVRLFCSFVVVSCCLTGARMAHHIINPALAIDPSH
jgi:hypothetical protein